MKKIVLVFLSLFVIIISCKKENKDNITNQKLVSVDDGELKKIRINNQKIDDIINLDTEDVENRKIQYIMGRALSNISWKKEFIDEIINDAKNSPLREANLKRVSSKNNDFLSQLNAEINTIEEGENLNTLIRKMQYDGKQYQPIIVIPNIDLDIINTNLKPITSHGLEVEEITVDDILASFLHENGTKTDVLLNENEAIKSLKPIFIFNYGLDDDLYRGKENIFIDYNQYYDHEAPKHDSAYFANLNSLKSTNTTSTKRFLNIHTSIKNESYFYESNGRNEYTQRAFYWNKYNNWSEEIYNEGGGNRINEIRRFSQSECNGQQYTTWDRMVYFSHTYYAPNIPYDIFNYRTYERDWWRSNKEMGNYTTYMGQTIYPFGKMHKGWHTYINHNWTYNDDQMSLWYYKNIQSSKSKAAFTRSY